MKLNLTSAELGLKVSNWDTNSEMDLLSQCGLNNSDCDGCSSAELDMASARRLPSNWTVKCLFVVCAAGSATRFEVMLLLIWFSDPRV